MSASWSGIDCERITDRRDPYADDGAWKYESVWCADHMVSDDGDSGSAIYRPRSNNGANAIGVLVGGFQEEDGDTLYTCFEPIGQAESLLNATVCVGGVGHGHVLDRPSTSQTLDRNSDDTYGCDVASGS